MPQICDFQLGTLETFYSVIFFYFLFLKWSFKLGVILYLTNNIIKFLADPLHKITKKMPLQALVHPFDRPSHKIQID